MPATAPLDSSGELSSDDEDEDEDEDEADDELVGLMTAVTVATEPLLSVLVATNVLGAAVDVGCLVLVVISVFAVRR